MTLKHWILIGIFAVLILWIIIDHFSHWEVTFHGDCEGYWFDQTCARCGYSFIQLSDADLMDRPRKCPQCERRMTNAR